jgi:hypothetical protein
MSAKVVGRKVRFFERQWPWLALAFSVTLFLLLAAGLSLAGMLTIGSGLRGYTGTGLFLGVVAVFCGVVTFVYSMRKRSLQERFPLGRSTMMTWLWVHVYFGLLAIVAAGLHAGFGLFSGPVSSGKLLALAFFLLGASGVAWRLAYRFVPPRAAPKIGNYSQEGAKKRADEQLLEIEKIAAGKSPQFHAWKTAALASPAQAAALAQRAAPGMPPNERSDIEAILRLIASRARALTRMHLQTHYASLLQSWRILHVPLTFLAIGLLGWHVVRALGLDAPVAAAVGAGGVASMPPAEDCASCHKATYDAWSHSMHAHALRGPIALAQNNVDLQTSLKGAKSPDPLLVCVNCHAPVGTAITQQAKLPLPTARENEGVDCVTCHQYTGKAPAPGSAGLSRWQNDLTPGSEMVGPFDEAVGNGYHRSRRDDLQASGDLLCASCHDVNYDRDGDGKITKGKDLVLQQTFDEYQRYRQAGGKDTCVSCHMPVVASATRAADQASIPLDQDYAAPARTIHDHAFVGVDYPLDVAAADDVQKDKRAALLRSGVAMTLQAQGAVSSGKTMKIAVTLQNLSGHRLPTGFAFARQLFVELTATANGSSIFSSGVLAKNTDDLCDAATLAEDASTPVRKAITGCTVPDPQLVNIQTKLVDKIETRTDGSGQTLVDVVGEAVLFPTEDAHESVSQFLTGGAVARQRPLDKKPMVPLEPGESQTYVYSFKAPDAGNVTVTARLRFRNIPPYFLRALAAAQGPNDPAQIAPLVQNVQIVDVAQATLALTPNDD